MASLSLLQKLRMDFQPKLPPILDDIRTLKVVKGTVSFKGVDPLLKTLFPFTSESPLITFQKGEKGHPKPLTVGVLLSGGQAPGGHNVIAGLFDALKKIDPQNRLIGICGGPGGLIKKSAKEITAELLLPYRNQGGFDLIGTGRTKIETDEQFAAAEKTILDLKLDGLVIIGGDDSNTNAAFLAEYFKGKNLPVSIVGVPKTIDGDLKNDFIEIPFGFDTACKTYAEIVGNISRDALSAKKYYHFIKLMGRSASHLTLECALQTHPNMALIGEEVAQQKQTLEEIVKQIAAMISARAAIGKYYGVILIPEGIIEFIPEFKMMMGELNAGIEAMSASSKHCYDSLPETIQKQLLLDRDPHGNVQVSKIETERLLIELVEKELAKTEVCKGKFSAQPHFCGYEGRSALPSNFDSQYCYTLGHVAALLVAHHANGYMSCVKNLAHPISQWEIMGAPLYPMLHHEERGGKMKAVIEKALVDLEGELFTQFRQQRERWMMEDDYCNPGPIQFFGPTELTDKPIF